MTSKTRTLLLTAFCAAVLPLQVSAQTDANKKYPSSRGPNRAKASLSTPAKLFEAEQATALSIINSLIEASEHYRNETLSVRTQARAADALWTIDQTRARNVFLRAWDHAKKVDEEAEGNAEEARKLSLAGRAGVVTMVPPLASLRSEVLKLAAHRDPSLGEALMAKLNEKREGDEPPSSELSDPTEPTLDIAKRLEVALNLLQAGDLKQAKAFAEPALVRATSPGIIFIATLRQKDAEAADMFYAGMLSRAETDITADATTVSLLSSYAFTPGVLVTATRRGRVSNQYDDSPTNYELPETLRMRFLQVGASILLRPPVPAPQDTSLAGHAGTYFTVARLLPIFVRYAPNYVAALNAQLTLLAPDSPETFRNGQESMLRLGLESKPSGENTIGDILTQLDQVENSGDRDVLYVKAIRTAATTYDPRIRDFADKIEDDGLRERARSFTDFVLVRRAIKNRDVDSGLRITNSGNLPPLQRLWALSQLSRLVKGDRGRAVEILENAATEADRLEPGAEDRVLALAAVSSNFFKLDRSRSWTIAYETVRAANSVPGFTGEDAKLSARLRAKNVISMISIDEPSFSVATLFDLLSQDDLQIAMTLANGLKEESPRAVATLAVATSVLKKLEAQHLSSKR